MHNPFSKAALFAVFLTIAFMACWEIYLRKKHLSPCYDDGSPLWADKREKVYQSPERAIVFIGSSRIKYDLDIDTWRTTTGMDAVQLAMEGNSPLPILNDLANDEKFHGNLVVDVTEGLFFSTSPRNTSEPATRIKYYKDRTPAEYASFQINRYVDPAFVFLDQDNFSMNALISKIHLPNRKGVNELPIFPTDFGRNTYDRQSVMTERFVKDTNLRKKVTDIWQLYAKMSTEPPASGRKLDSILQTIYVAVDKIKKRGGDVFFVRTPSSGPFLKGEQARFPRDKYWDRLLRETNSKGIYFQDFPEIANFDCPEWSHLSQADAIVFTKAFANILRQQNWPGSRTTASR